VPGVLSTINFLYTVTEIFEFATRLCERRIYRTDLRVKIEVKQIKGFILSEENGFLPRLQGAGDDDIGKEWMFSAKELIVGAKDHSLKAVGWFFEQFGWLNPPLAALKNEQERFLKGLI
jgi:hypothetical protein